MSASAPSWLDGLGASVVEYASSALQLGNEAAAALGDQLGAALARLQGLPVEASACVDELATAVCALLGQDGVPALDSAGVITAAGRPGGFGETARVVPQVVPRRTRIDAAAFARFIRAQHPHKPAEHAAALTGIAVDSVEKILARESLPNGPNFLRCVIAYGPALLAAVLPDAEERWLIGAQILADQARLETELARTRAAMAENAGRWSFCGISFGAAP